MFGDVSHFFLHILDTQDFPPRWHCGIGWDAFTGWLYIISNIAIWGAYFAIPLVLNVFIRRKKNLPFPKIFLLFGAFIFACGLTHLLDAAMFWWPGYRLNALILCYTGIISWLTVFALIPVCRQAMMLKTPEELEALISQRTAELEAQKKRAEKSEARFKRIMHANIIGMFFCNFEGQIIEANDAFLTMIGYNQSDLAEGRLDWRHLTPTEYLPQDEAIIAKLMDEGVSGVFEKQYIHQNGHRVDLLFSVATLDLEPVCAVLALDITRQKTDQRALKASESRIRELNIQLEEKVKERTMQLEEANLHLQMAYQELESFSYSVSHDLRAPLRSLHGFSTILLNDYADKLDDTGKDYLSRLRNNSQKMGDLINHLLHLSQVSRAEIHRKPVNLSALCLELADEWSDQAKPDSLNNLANSTEFVIQPDVLVQADAVLMRSVLDNLLGNAYKFSRLKPQPRVEFGVMLNEQEEPVYFVRDNGVGFDMAYAGQLFQSFQRLHREDEFKGTGIGLATAQRIITRHGGRIWAEAEPGKGATFFFTLG